MIQRNDYRTIIKRVITSALALTVAFSLTGCGEEKEEIKKETPATVTVGFSQIGAESDWRLASTASMRSAFNESTGYKLMMDDGQQKQENQLKAMRKFVDSGVDYIVLDPITETGWDATLQEASEANIPVIIVDRRVDVENDDVYVAWIGSDFRLEGDRACAWLEAYLASIEYEDEVNIAHIQGTVGSSAQIGRTEALEEKADACGWNIIAQEDADFVQAKGKEVMERMLAEFGDTINVVYCENDSEALGAIEALKERGMRPGKHIQNGEVLVVSFDATREGLLKTLSGEITVDTECNPNYGAPTIRLINSLQNGLPVEHDNYMEESQFSTVLTVTEVKVDGKPYKVTHLNRDMLDNRNY